MMKLRRPGRSSSPRPPRLLLVESSLRENGGLRVALAYARRWAASADVDLAVVQDVTDDSLAHPDPVVSLHFLSAKGSRFRYGAVTAFVRLCRLSRRADVLVSGAEEGNCLLLGWLAARVTRRPFVILTQIDLPAAIEPWVPRALQPLTRWINRRSDASICVSDSTRDSVVANGLPSSRAHVVHNGVDAAAIRAAAADVSEDDPGPGVGRGATIVACGRLADAKGFATLIDAHARSRRPGTSDRLVILGEGPARAELEAQAEQLGVATSVSMPGFVSNPYSVMACADLFVLSSQFEGTPLVLLEAMVLGLPIVSTRCGSAPEAVLEGGRCGRLVDVGATEQLAEAISDHLRDPTALRACAARATERVRRYDVDEAADRAREVLESVMVRRDGA